MTVSTREKLFAICTDCNVPEESFNSILQIVEDEIHGMDRANNELYRSKNELTSKYEAIQRDFLENASKANSKLMSVYYLLDAVAKTGTHREKETVIMYMKVVIDGLVQRPLGYWLSLKKLILESLLKLAIPFLCVFLNNELKIYVCRII